MASIGTVIDNKYEIIAEIGKGGMSTVYLALDRRLNKQWAIKEAKKKPGEDSNVYELTPIAEANLLKSLDHPNIVRIVDIIEQGGYIYIVEDFVEGKALSEEVKKGPSHPEDVINWASQLCDVFTYIHSKNPPIIYRDMKPANVQLDTEKKNVKLLDFGIAKTYKAQNTSDTTNLGTRGYAAPEQFDVNRQSDARTDIFSLGVTVRSLLMGKTPYDAEFYDDIRKQNPLVTDGLIKVINKATNQNPDNRYQTAEEFKHALQHYHDNDAAVIKVRKKAINNFRSILISGIAMVLIGVIMLPLTSLLKSQDYNDKLKKAVTQAEYEECINLDPKRSEAYFKEIETISNISNLNVSGFTEIRNFDDKMNFALEFATMKTLTITNNVPNSTVSSYYELLAKEMNENEETLNCMQPTNKLTVADLSNEKADIRVSIGRIMTYFYQLSKLCGDRTSNTKLDRDTLYNNLDVINGFIKDNEGKLTGSEDLERIFEQVSNKYQTDAKNFYDFIVLTEYNVLTTNDFRNAFGSVEDGDNGTIIKSIVVQLAENEVLKGKKEVENDIAWVDKK